MRIKTQLQISIITFSVILVIIGSSVTLTQIQITDLNNQSALTNEIQTGASDLNYISNNYFLYQDNSYITLWQTKFSKFCSTLESLNTTNPRQQALVNTVDGDLDNLNNVFAGVIDFLSNAPRNVSVRVLPSFQTQWNRMAVQIQALAFDSQQLSQNIQDQTNQAIQINTIFTIALLSIFSVFFVTIYFVAYRKTAISIDKLKNGIGIIGSGNLDYTIDAGKKDEIADISKSVNQMAANLKTVTASKTDLEQAQFSLQESEQHWATTLASIGDAVISTDASGKITFMNREAEDLTGWRLSDASLKPINEVFHIINEQSRAEVENPVNKVLEKNMIVGLANHTILVKKNKTEVAIDDSGAPIKDKDGKTTGVVLVFRDITERKKAEEALRESEQLYHSVFDNSQDGFQLIELVYDKNGKPTDHKFLKVNRAYEKIIGVKAEDILDKTAKYISPNQELHWLEVPDRVAKTGISEHVELFNKDINKTLDCFYFLYSANVVGTLFRDVSERKNMEKKLQDQERLAAIGATAGMVGHDIRNPLQAITGDLYFAKTELAALPDNKEKSSVLECLGEIENSVDYINKIVADLQDFARPLNPRAQETNVESLFKEILAKNGIGKNIKVSVEVEEEAKRIMADPDFLKRIVANLVLNAVQAMPEGGELTIHAYADKATDDVLITVKDTGVGIPDDIKSKLFTPMMTTKAKGQGFGLAVVKRMTEGLGGTVNFESQEGKGTTFIIRLPPPQRAKR